MRACQMRSRMVGSARRHRAMSRTKSSYNYSECFDLIDRLEHDTFDYIERLQVAIDREFTDDELLMLAADHINDILSDDQLVDLYGYFGYYVGTKTVLNDEQKARVIDALADMVVSHFDDLN